MANKNEMSPGEERIAFYHELGMSITQWAMVELSIFNVAATAIDKKNIKQLSVAFFAIENFRSKLSFADKFVSSKCEEMHLYPVWQKLADRAKASSQNRNQLAHRRLMNYPASTAGRRMALIEWHSDNPKKPSPDKPFGSAICLFDLAKYRMEFSAVSISLWNFADKLSGHAASFPEDAESSQRPPTILELSTQIHAILGHQRPPSKRSQKRAAGNGR